MFGCNTPPLRKCDDSCFDPATDRVMTCDDLPPGAAIPVSDEGSEVTPAVTSIDFVGDGVTATAVGGAVTVTIPGGGGGQALEDCAGVVLPNGAQVVQCADIGVTVQGQLQTCDLAPLPADAPVVQCSDVGVTVQGQLQRCDTSPLPAGTPVLECQQLEEETIVNGNWRFANATLEAYREGQSAQVGVSGAVNLDVLTGAPTFDLSLVGNAALTFSVPENVHVFNLTVLLRQDAIGNRVVTWPGTVRWQNGTVPTQTLTPNAVDVFTFFTTDGGANWWGFPAGLNML
jgi:hypothetical protein